MQIWWQDKCSEKIAMDNNGRDHSDLVDEFYTPLVRPLGNLVILFAQAEADLLQLLAELSEVSDPIAAEMAAHQIYKSQDAKQNILSCISAAAIEPAKKSHLSQAVADFWSDRERRNRLIHDEWHISLGDRDIAPATRGIPRKKAAEITYDQPTAESVWQLALRFRDHGHTFSAAAYFLGKGEDDGA